MANVIRIALMIGVGLSLSACSYIAGWFPDKQKQYRYSTELPDLEVPPDLTSPTGGEGVGRAAKAPSRVEKGAAREEEIEAPVRSRSGKKRSQAKTPATASTLARDSAEAPMIEIEESFAEAWNDVNRALGRLELEVADQNRSDGVYYVYYGGDGKKPKEKEEPGLWNDIVSVFKSEQPNAREYRLKLEEKGDFTHIHVLNRDGEAVNEGQGVELLQRLHEKLQTLDQPEGEPGKNEAKAKP